MENHTKVGVGIMIWKDSKILLGKRKASHGSGQYAFPGGHLEHLESFTDCALREIAEECGIEVQNIQFQFLANLTEYAPKHYCHIGLTAEWKSGDPKVLEPEKCESWDWFDVNDLPSPLFAACTQAIESFKTGNKFFDSN